MKAGNSNFKFIWILMALNLALALYATPVTDLGDAGSYIDFSRTILGEASNYDYSHRSPLFSVLMAGFMLILKAPALFKIMVIFQYTLVALTSWLVYRLSRRLVQNDKLAMISALLFNLSFSTIFYANILLTEILSVFLLVLSVHLLLRVFDRGGRMRILALGVAVGMLSLARFNTLPLIITFFVLLGYVLFRREESTKKWVLSIAVFFASYALVINLWCLYNYFHNDFYGLYPGAQIKIPQNPRNITIASIHPGNTVSEMNRPVLDIFLEAREKFLAEKKNEMKGSLAFLYKKGFLTGLYSGYAVFRLAIPALRVHYNLPDTASESEISSKIVPFIREISAQNTRFILKYRFYSLLSGFRASVGGALPSEYGNINLNVLPSLAFKAYKIIFFFISLFVFTAFFHFLFRTVSARFKADIPLLTLFFIIFSFWGINFVFFTVGDANRYKFPAEPFIILLFMYYVDKIFRQLRLGSITFNSSGPGHAKKDLKGRLESDEII